MLSREDASRLCSGDDGQELRFNYDQLQRIVGTAAGLSLVALATLLCFVDANDVRSSPSERTWFLFVLGLAIGFYLLVVVGAFLRTSVVVIGNNGVHRRVFGICWRQIAWSNVRRIRIMQATALASVGGKPITQYFLDQTTSFHFPYAPGGPIFFTSQIQGHELLLKILNGYVSRFHIPVVDQRPGANGAPLQQLE